MAKINYTEVELKLIRHLERTFVAHVAQLASIAIQAREGTTPLDTKMVDDILKSFRAELRNLKKKDPEYYKKLALSEKDEARFLLPCKDFSKEDWSKLIDLNERLLSSAQRRETIGGEEITPEDLERVAKERTEHKNKRFNVRKGWLPLH